VLKKGLVEVGNIFMVLKIIVEKMSSSSREKRSFFLTHLLSQ
jgi:hypothetical protein